MKNDPFYLSKDKSLEASLGVLSVDGNFEESIAYFYFFVKFFEDYKIPVGCSPRLQHANIFPIDFVGVVRGDYTLRNSVLCQFYLTVQWQSHPTQTNHNKREK